MDSDLPRGLSLNPNPQNKIFQTTTEQVSPAELSKGQLDVSTYVMCSMSWLQIVLKEVFTILPKTLCYLFLWKTIIKQLNNRRKLNEEHNTIVILNSTTRNIFHFNSTNCSPFSTDLILAISCGTIHNLMNKYLQSIYYMLTSVSYLYNQTSWKDWLENRKVTNFKDPSGKKSGNILYFFLNIH